MSDDLAELGFDVDSRPVKTATDNVRGFGEQGAKTDKKIKGATDGINRSFGGVAGSLKSVAVVAGAAFAALGATSALQSSMTQAREYGSALAEVGTLIEGTAQQTAYLDAESRRLAATYGGTGTAQAQAFYQAISAGAQSVEEAGMTLDAANRLAIGGVTDVTTAVGVLSTAMNVYAEEGLTAADASDAIFVAVKAGVTTVGELSSSIGKVLPLAQKMGLTFDETAAATAALTKGGLSTAEAVTGLRASLASVLGPSGEAQKLAAQLGLDFSAAGLEARGFAGFMEEVVRATNGSAEQMQTLFGSVEAVGAALAFSGSAGASMADILGQMEQKAGATSEAFGKMSDDMQQRLNVVMGKLWSLTTSIGSALLTVLVPALEGAASAMEFVAENSDVFGSILVGLAASTIPAVVASISSMIPLLISATTAASGLGVAMYAALGPFGIVAGLVSAAAAYFLVFRDNSKLAEDGAYNAAAASAQLSGELAVFHASAAPEAATSAIELANANHELAASAFEAARGELAKVKAMNAAAEARLAEGGGVMPFGTNLGNQQATEAAARLAAAERDLERAIRDRKVAVTAVTGAMSETMTANDEATKSLKITVDGLDDVTTATTGATTGLNTTASATGQAADAIADLNTGLEETPRLVDDLSDAWGDFVASGFRDFVSFRDSVLDSFKRMIVEMVTTAARNRIVIGIGMATSGGTAAAAAQSTGGGMLGNGGLLGGLLKSGGGLLGGIGSAASGIWSGLSGVFSGGGIGSSFANLGGLVTGASSGFGALGAALPALGIVAAGIAILAKGLSREYDGRAIRGNLGPTGFTGSEFDFYDGGFLRGDKTTYMPVRTELQTMLDDTASGIRDNVRRMADTLNLGSEAIEDFTARQFTVWLSGPNAGTEEQIAERLEQELAVLADGMSDLVFSAEDFARAGESSYETLTRLGTSLANANHWMENLGLRTYEASLAGGAAASAFVDLFGTLEGFTTSSAAYYQNFYTDAERAMRASELLSIELAALGIDTLPRTRAQFRALVDEADQLGETGLVASLIQLAPAFAQITDQANALNDALTGASPYRTLADAVFAGTATGYTRPINEVLKEENDELKAIMREVVTAIREGDLNNARINSKILSVQERAALEPSA